MPAPSPCSKPGCPVLVAHGDGPRCVEHKRAAWSSGGSSGLPSSWPRLRGFVLTRDRRCCYKCGAEASEVDHVVPRAEGGGHELTNLAAICDACHKVKSEKEKLKGIDRRYGM